MSATSTPTNFSDLYTDLLNRIRADTSQTATAQQARRYINIALQDMHLGTGEKFHWAERQATLTTQPDYTTGTVTITQGSTTLTGSSTAWTTTNAFGIANARAGGKIVINGGKEVYRVSSVGSATSITLENAFVKSDVSAGTYTYFENEYSLASDFLKPIDVRSFDINGEIRLVSRTRFREMWVQTRTPGKPRFATFMNRGFDSDTTYQRRIWLHQPPDDAYLIPYAYVTSNLGVTASGVEQADLSSDDDEPIVPLGLRHGIVLHALASWYRDKKNDPRSQQVLSEYNNFMARVVSDNEIGSPRPRFEPRVAHHRANAKRPWRRGRAGRYVTGGAFDEFRE